MAVSEKVAVGNDGCVQACLEGLYLNYSEGELLSKQEFFQA